MKEKFIIRVLASASNIISLEQARELREILYNELYNYELTTACTALVPMNNMIEIIKLFIATKELDGLSKNTLKSYGRHLYHFSRAIQKNIEDINEMDVRKFLYAKKATIKSSSLNTITSTLKSFFSWLQLRDYIIKNPLMAIKASKTPKRVRKYLSTIELELIRNANRNIRDTALVEFFYSTGCRLDEVYKLNQNDIDWESGRISVIGKGDKERIVCLNAKARVHLRIYLNSRTDLSEALFVGERAPHNRLGARAIQRVFNFLGKLAKINRNVYPHLIRHTTMTHMFQNGATLAEVQGYAGHDDPSTTQIYAQQDKEAIYQSFKRNLAG